jgi:threonine dehydratase
MAKTMDLISIAEIKAAADALPSLVRRIPLLPLALHPAEIGAEHLFLKLENLQVTGAYKVRAAFTVVASLSARQCACVPAWVRH